jgi:hypothetical protein
MSGWEPSYELWKAVYAHLREHGKPRGEGWVLFAIRVLRKAHLGKLKSNVRTPAHELVSTPEALARLNLDVLLPDVKHLLGGKRA